MAPLLSITAVPPHLRFNGYVRSGYRSISSPLACAVGALTTISNETGNIATHALAAAAFGWVTSDAALWVALPAHYVLVRIFFACATFTMLGSVGYHTFMAACGTAAAYEALLLFDVVGVWVLGVSVTIMSTLYGYLLTPPGVKWTVVALIVLPSLWRLVMAKSAGDRGIAFAIIAFSRLTLSFYRLIAAPTPGDLGDGAFVWVCACCDLCCASDCYHPCVACFVYVVVCVVLF